jgi:hypothetical protein
MADENKTTLELDDDLSRVHLWKNLIFLRDGRSVLGYHIFATKEEAAQGCRDGETWIAAHPGWRVICPHSGEHLYSSNNYSHCIQVPYDN